MNKPFEIGGYFELTLPLLPKYREFIHLFNMGRSALAFLLDKQGIKKVYLPYYTCEVILEPLKKLEIDFEFYSINKQLIPIDNWERIDESTAVIVNNYFGLLDTKIERLPFINNVIVDNSQAFYSNVIGGFGGFNSFRKFFGLADGAEALLPENSNYNIEINGYRRYMSSDKMAHLLGRIESGAESYYNEFSKNDAFLKFNNIQQISKISERLYGSIDHQSITKRRIENFSTLHKILSPINQLKINIGNSEIPFVYPLWINNGSELRSHLISNKVYTAKYWPNTKIDLIINSLETDLTENIIALPIDQRYDVSEMNIILSLILDYVK